MLTVDKQVKIRLIGYYITTQSDGKVCITNSYDQRCVSDNLIELLDFLYKPYRTEDIFEVKVMFDLDVCVSHLFKLMSEDECRKVLSSKFSDKERIHYRYKLNFMIKGNDDNNVAFRGKPYVARFYNLSNFFDVSEDDEPKDAIQTVKYGFRLLDGIKNIGIDYPMNMNSSIGMWVASNRNVSYTPKIESIPVEYSDIIKYAYDCGGHQGWLTVNKIGYFNNAYSYDLSSAYGLYLSQIRDYKRIEITPYDKNKPYIHKDDIFASNVTGFFRCQITINKDVKLHPFAMKWNDEVVAYPVGTWEGNLVLEEILYIYRHKLGTVKILSGYYVRFLSKSLPMRRIVNQWFEWRSKGKMESDIAKGIITGYVGKTRQVDLTDNHISEVYYPLISAQIYSQCRLRVFDFIRENELTDDIICIQTDGVTSLKPALKTPMSDKKVMGKWRFEGQQDVCTLSRGYIFKPDKKPHSITMDMLMAKINSEPDANYYVFVKNKTVTLYEALDKLKDYKLVGTKADFIERLDMASLQGDLQRIYPEYPKSGKDLISGKCYNSYPMEYDMLKI